jgi:hypothetical protein
MSLTVANGSNIVQLLVNANAVASSLGARASFSLSFVATIGGMTTKTSLRPPFCQRISRLSRHEIKHAVREHKRDALGPEELLAGFSLVGFLQGKEGRGFAVPSDFVPKSFSVSAHDLERGD